MVFLFSFSAVSCCRVRTLSSLESRRSKVRRTLTCQAGRQLLSMRTLHDGISTHAPHHGGFSASLSRACAERDGKRVSDRLTSVHHGFPFFSPTNSVWPWSAVYNIHWGFLDRGWASEWTSELSACFSGQLSGQWTLSGRLVWPVVTLFLDPWATKQKHQIIVLLYLQN